MKIQLLSNITRKALLLMLIAAEIPSLFAQTPPEIIRITSNRQVVNRGGQLTLEVLASNATSYQWFLNNREIPGATKNSLEIRNASYSHEGAYVAQIRNSALGAGSVPVLSKPIFVILAPYIDGSSRIHTVTPGNVTVTGAAVGNPTPAPTHLTDLVNISDNRHNRVLGLRRDGSVVAWGTADSLNVSSGARLNEVPPGLSDIVSVAAGDSANIALRSDGTVFEWSHGSVRTVPEASGSIAISASTHFVALKSDGRVVAWGQSANAPNINLPTTLTGVTAIAAGQNATFVATANEGILGYGFNFGNCGTVGLIPPGIRDAISLKSGYHNMALRADGSLRLWGNCSTKDLPFQSTNSVLLISASTIASFAILEDRSAIGWGSIPPAGSGPTLAWGWSVLNGPARLRNSSEFVPPPIFRVCAPTWTTVFLRETGGDRGPSFRAAPLSTQVNLDDLIVLSCEVDAFPAPTFQWRKNGVDIPGATDGRLTILRATSGDEGRYSVKASNFISSSESPGADVRVRPPAPAAILSQPTNLRVSLGDTAVLSAIASGSPTPSFQWFKNGNLIPGATLSNLRIPNVSVADAGNYSVSVKNTFGLSNINLTSSSATLAVSNPSHLINLSILTILERGESMTLGTVLGGERTSGSKALLIRAAGPSLAPLGVADFIQDPFISVYRGQSSLATNDNWGGASSLAAVFTGVGAFSYLNSSSLDSAYYNATLASGSYTVELRGVGSSAGSILAELYDATPAASRSISTPRLVNVSVLKEVKSGTTLTAGFVVGGDTSVRVLVRAVGPTLAGDPFGISSAISDPQLVVYSGQTSLASNDNWGEQSVNATASDLSLAFNSVGAFRLAGTSSKDAAVLLSLSPGNYTAVISGANNSGGLTLVEVYEVP